MSHYNLYTSLGLERSHTADDISRDLTARLQADKTPNPGGREEVELAREILGNADKRAMYDARLDDDNAADITPQSLRELAAMDIGPQVSDAQPLQESGHRRSSKAGSSLHKPAIMSAVAGLVVGALLAGIPAIISSGGGSGSDIKGAGGAKKMAKEFLNLRTPEETEQWVADNVPGESRKNIRSQLGLGNEFSGVDQYFGTGDLEYFKMVDGMGVSNLSFPVKGMSFQEAVEDKGIDSIAIVGYADSDESLRGTVTLARIDGDWKLVEVIRHEKGYADDPEDAVEYLIY